MTRRLEPALVSATLHGVRVARRALESLKSTREHWDQQTPELKSAAADLARQMDDADVGLLTPRDDAWPTMIDDLSSPPPFLYFRGDLDLLNRPGIGMCGSRHASERGLRAARVAGSESAKQNVHVISGYARGVDTETHIAALQAGAGTVIVLAEGILNFKEKRIFQAAGVSLGQALILSQFAPAQRWSAGAAMTRNGIICALGHALVVVEAGESGGTLNAGRQAMKIGRPVFALQFGEGGEDTPTGNRVLFGEGASRLASTGQLRTFLEGLPTAS